MVENPWSLWLTLRGVGSIPTAIFTFISLDAQKINTLMDEAQFLTNLGDDPRY
jgi:hypothetical protein